MNADLRMICHVEHRGVLWMLSTDRLFIWLLGSDDTRLKWT